VGGNFGNTVQRITANRKSKFATARLTQARLLTPMKLF
jgi:hypothetical protein